MSPIVATLATAFIFFVPGLLVVLAWPGRDGDEASRLTFPEQAYVTIAASFLFSGWVGLTLAELGWFSPTRVAAVVAGASVVTAVLLRRRLALRIGSFDGKSLIVAGGMLAFALVAYFPPFEYILGGRDPGLYTNTGFHLAREGTLVYTDPLVESIPENDWPLFYRVDKPVPEWRHLRFQGFALESPESARVVPQGLHLYPVWIGVASALFEMKAGLYATPFFALLGVFGFYFALRRLFGFEIAAWAALMLSVFQIEVWFARFPNSEVVCQFLYVTALFFFYFANEHRNAFAGALSGIALGATLLARMENILFIVPIALFMGFKRMRRELALPELAFLSGFGVVALHAALHDRFISWPYVSEILGRHYWRFLGENLVVVAIVGVVLAVVVDRLSLKIPSGAYDALQSVRLRLTAAVLLFGLAAYAYFIRPVWHGPRTAFQDAEAFLRMGWYLYPAGLALAIAGAMVLIVRARKSQVFFLLVGLTFSLFFFYKVRVWHDHYFAMRRFIPVILPSLIACLSIFLVSVRTDGRWTRWGSRVIAAFLIALFATDGRRLWALGGHNEFRGSLDFVEELSRHIGENDVVIFPRREGLHLLELPLSELEGKNVLEFYTLSPPRELIEDLLVRWQDVYGDVYFVTNYKISLSGLFTRHVADFGFATEKFQYAYRHPPEGPEPFHLRFTLSKAVDMDELAESVPELPFLDVGGSDDLQVAWFHEKELDGETSYRWSQRVSSVYVPAVGGGTPEVRITLAGPKEDEAPLNPVEVRLDGDAIATLTPTREFVTHSVPLPPRIADRTARAPVVLTLHTETWRPSNVVPGSEDVRELGVRVDSVEVVQPQS